jgi:hypothetical protein
MSFLFSLQNYNLAERVIKQVTIDLFTPTKEAAVRTVNFDTKCLIKRSCMQTLNWLFLTLATVKLLYVI